MPICAIWLVRCQIGQFEELETVLKRILTKIQCKTPSESESIPNLSGLGSLIGWFVSYGQAWLNIWSFNQHGFLCPNGCVEMKFVQSSTIVKFMKFIPFRWYGFAAPTGFTKKFSC